MKLLIIFSLVHIIKGILGDSNTTNKRLLDDYYLNYDYEMANNSVSLEFRSDSLILPIPERIDAVDKLPNIELPDNSLSDSDLKDHDFIDNLMYVYYGSNHRSGKSYGPEIIIIGSVLSCAAQLLTLFRVLLKKNLNGRRDMKTMFTNVIGTFCLSNLIFMLGVYATRTSSKCLIIAIIMHYFHLLTAIWIFVYCFYIYKKMSPEKCATIKYFYLYAYGMPLFLSMVSYCLTPQSYESKRFCFISVQKGMIVNYMVPVSFLIILTTIYSLNGIRKINMELSKLEFNNSVESLIALRNTVDFMNGKKAEYVDNEILSLRESKSCLKLLCVFQTGYDIVWFIVVLALENVNNSHSMAIVYAITSCLLNWYIFIKAKVFLPTIMSTCNILDEIVVTENEKTISYTLTASHQESDSIPLLINIENCTELKELNHEYNISTISN